MRVAVIGLGGTGSAALRFLAQAGVDAVGFEQFGPGHNRGSSHGESRIIRYTYPDPFYTRLMADAYPLWHHLQQEADEELLVPCGIIACGSSDNSDLRAIESAMISNDVAFDVLTDSERMTRVPSMKFGAQERVVLQQDGGFLRASRCVAANIRLAQHAGATIHWNTPVQAISQVGDGVTVCLENGETERFDRAVVASGPWVQKFAAELNIPSVVTRQEVFYIDSPEIDGRFAPRNMPVWIDFGSMWYGFPSDGVKPGIKIARHVSGPKVDPDNVDRDTTMTSADEVLRAGESRLGLSKAHIIDRAVCLYTTVPDEDFILQTLPSVPSATLVSGCSGHGFKFTVLLGRIAADLALTGTCPWDISRFSASRFSA